MATMNAAVRQYIDLLEFLCEDLSDAHELPRIGAQFCHAVVLSTGAKNAVEIGTGYGYSTLWIGAALQETGGGLITIDCDARKSAQARQHARRAGLDAIIDFRQGEAAEILKSLEGPIDFVLNDADKNSCIQYVETLLPKLSDRAVVLTDNIHTHSVELADFLFWARSQPSLFSTEVRVGNGMEMTIKRPGVAETP
jgi:predicted O-methyltransferase YrrM